ncbi:MAG: transporter substrate-binding protein [Paenibacillus sp.]|jgi:putative aldouronate transport system substrate-binding protein|uniref:Extracellular solute-binding protein n=1 Tax=Paenibacillus hemerocallicola TaxID=1172614 RepID=A0A5C4SZ96_9BACL|nr:extracellular solute-binding protein [Paenibacillus hemerocallicola]MDF2662216.1 transporter substrate-binding protein [Paenibacillus sp.]TNJ61890.1 extracellular solute-binding protein [Paenibacillus hemerocallicola]
MFKKTLSVLSIATLAASVAACGSATDSKTSGGSTTPADNKQAEANKPKPEFKALLQYSRFDPNAEFVAKYLNEKTGYKTTYDMLPVENFDEKLNLLMANKEPYAFMKLNATQYAKLASSGALEPLDELINKYGTNMKNVISQTSWNGAKLDGKIYGIPETGSGTIVNTALVTRQDWIDELGLKMPTTRDEFYTFLKTIREKKNVIPLTGGKSPMLAEVASTFGVTTTWNESGGKLTHMVENPGMKQYLAFMKKLYDEKLIDPEWSINQSNKVIENFTSGKAAIMMNGYYNMPTITTALNKNFPNAKIATMPFMKGDSGKMQVVAGGSIGWFIAVPKWSENKEEIIKYLDLKLDKDIFKGAAIGQEGVHHKFENGNYLPILPKFNDDLNNASSFLTGVDEKNYPIYWQARVRKDPVLTDAFTKIQENAKGSTVTDPLAFAPPIDAIAKNAQKLNKFMEDTFIKFIAGGESLDNYDKFLTQWKADGGADMIKAANDWYATTKK